jgi:hypothetical protein
MSPRGSFGFGTFTAAPEHVGRRPEFSSQVEVPSDLGERVAAHGAVVGGERAVLEDGVGEQVRGGHRHPHPGALERRLETVDGARPRVGVGAGWDEVVVVEGDPVRPELGQALHGRDRVERRTGGLAERIAGLPSDGPQTEREAVLRGWFQGGHDHSSGAGA